MADEKEFEGDGGYPGVSNAVEAVIDFYGPSDLTFPAAYNPEAILMTVALFGVSYDQNPSFWKSGCPFFYVKAGDPPMLLARGDADEMVPLKQSMLLDKALTKVGLPHPLLVVKNAGHGLAPTPGTTIDPSDSEIDKTVFAFFDKYLKTP